MQKLQSFRIRVRFQLFESNTFLWLEVNGRSKKPTRDNDFMCHTLLIVSHDN